MTTELADLEALESYHARLHAKNEMQSRHFDRVIRVCNNAMKTALRECPVPTRTPELCANCGNEPCIKAWKELEKLWKECE